MPIVRCLLAVLALAALQVVVVSAACVSSSAAVPAAPSLAALVAASRMHETPSPDAIARAINGGPDSAVANTLASLLSPDVYANARYIYPPSGCGGSTRPHPFMVAGVRPTSTFDLEVQPGPIVDQEYRVVFFTCAMPTQSSPTPDAVWIVVGHNPAWTPRPAPWSGCWQMVDVDALIPVGVAVGWQGGVKREPGSDGRVELRWAPPATMVGQRVQLQLLVFAAGVTPSGFDLSQAIDLTVGTK